MLGDTPIFSSLEPCSARATEQGFLFSPFFTHTHYMNTKIQSELNRIEREKESTACFSPRSPAQSRVEDLRARDSDYDVGFICALGPD